MANQETLSASGVGAIDCDALARYLAQHLDGFRGDIVATKFSGGQSNPTFLLKSESGEFVLRRKPPGALLASAHAVDREYRVLCALENTGVPVARGVLLCEDETIIGSMFYLMEFVSGQVFWDPALPELESSMRRSIYHALIDNLAALHEVDVHAVGLADYGKPGNYFERQINRWTGQYRAAETETLADMESLIDWLPENLPPDDGQVSLIHGDYRMDNFIFEKGESTILAVLDWELSTLGHPLADLAYFCMCLRLPASGFPKGLAGLDREVLCLPSEREIVLRYCEQRGLTDIPHWRFYLAFSFFRLAAICQGVLRRALDGNASSEKAFEAGKQTPILASLGAQILK